MAPTKARQALQEQARKEQQKKEQQKKEQAELHSALLERGVGLAALAGAEPPIVALAAILSLSAYKLAECNQVRVFFSR